ncbi:MAG: hypothetical protein A3K76_04700 [Euryarchaeota archaeon RBG_13_57_23]|nr:MAG: hypothetical protein A3K76_04700 [Euryarchaeota archaeon RBG_13_57_23]
MLTAIDDSMSEDSQLAAPSRTKKPERPWGIILLAMWEIWVGIQMVIVGLAVVSFSSTLVEGSTWRNIVFLIGLGYFVIGISALLLARGYMKGYESSRRRGRSVAKIAILWAILGVLFLPPTLAPDSPFWTIVGNVIILLYLGSDKVVAYFKGLSLS